MESEEKKYIVINETPHYPLTFPSYHHMIDLAEDKDILHPLGIVYRAKIAHPDNMVRIVALRDNSQIMYGEGTSAFMFDKAIWLRYRNPFSPQYDATKTIISDRIATYLEKWRNLSQPILLGIVSRSRLTRIVVKSKVYKPVSHGIISRARLARRLIVNKIRSQTFR